MAPKKKPIIVRNIDGSIHKRYASVREAAEAYNAGHSNILCWIKSKKPKDGKIFEFENPADFKEGGYVYRRLRPKAVSTKNSELNKAYTILKYETRYNKVHITSCPFKEVPKPMI